MICFTKQTDTKRLEGITTGKKNHALRSGKKNNSSTQRKVKKPLPDEAAQAYTHLAQIGEPLLGGGRGGGGPIRDPRPRARRGRLGDSLHVPPSSSEHTANQASRNRCRGQTRQSGDRREGGGGALLGLGGGGGRAAAAVAAAVGMRAKKEFRTQATRADLLYLRGGLRGKTHAACLAERWARPWRAGVC